MFVAGEEFKGLSSSGKTSKVLVNKEGTKILKLITHFKSRDVLRREVFWLKRLAHTDFTPKLLDHSDNWILMTRVGSPLTRRTVPKDWRKQLSHIKRHLRRCNCRHNDAQMLVEKGKLFVIDFGWSSFGEDMSCGIGIDRRRKPHRARNSFRKFLKGLK